MVIKLHSFPNNDGSPQSTTYNIRNMIKKNILISEARTVRFTMFFTSTSNISGSSKRLIIVIMS